MLPKRCQKGSFRFKASYICVGLLCFAECRLGKRETPFRADVVPFLTGSACGVTYLSIFLRTVSYPTAGVSGLVDDLFRWQR